MPHGQWALPGQSGIDAGRQGGHLTKKEDVRLPGVRVGKSVNVSALDLETLHSAEPGCRWKMGANLHRDEREFLEYSIGD